VLGSWNQSFSLLIVRDEVFVMRSNLPFACTDLFGWHERSGALERLTPPWAPVEVLERRGSIHNGDRTILRIGPGLLARTWVAEHSDYEPGRRFRDVQVDGPLARWVHTHDFVAENAGCLIEDRVEFALPLSPLSRPALPRARRELQRTFAYRHRTLRDDLAMHARGGALLNVLITGASGVIGSVLAPVLTTGGHSVRRLTRGAPSREGEYRWDPTAGRIDPEALAGLDAVVHLAGETVAPRWSAAKKERIRRSRVDGTRMLSEALAKLARPPRVLVCASASGYYGDRGDEELTEQSAPGEGFLAEVVRAWEAAARPAEEAGIRVVRLRFGIVLSSAGGALRAMLIPFRLGAGGRFGSGRQWVSWISIDDLVGAVHHALFAEDLTGVANAVAPNPVTNGEQARTLGRVLGRPTPFPVPATILRLALGEFTQELLASRRVLPQRLVGTGYEFRHPELEQALRHLLGRSE
jgi:uncharacterized protein (TIGR01777 family)